MNPVFEEFVKSLEKKYQELINSKSLMIDEIPKKPGIYLFSENNKPLYVGRTKNLRRRRKDHTNPIFTQAPFAFRLAREKTGNIKATYKTKGSREDLMSKKSFQKAYKDSMQRIGRMKFQCIVETDPIMQTLLEVYVAVVLDTPYNDFDTH